MTHFPPKLPIPPAVKQKRSERVKSLLVSASYGITIRACIIIFELAGVWLYGSSALLVDAIASIVDIASSLLLLLFIKLASRPPDTSHPFGHGRYEPLVGLQLGLMLIGIGIFVGLQQIFKAAESAPEEMINPLASLFPLVAMGLLELCYQLLIRTAQRQNSPALAADAVHYRADAITSLFAFIALSMGVFKPEWSHLLDHMGAIAITFFMIVIGIFAARENIDQLLDRVLPQEFFDRVRKAALQVHGVLGTEKIRMQLYGPDAHVDIDIEVAPDLQVEAAHKISQKVRLEIQKEWPAVQDVTVHIEPYYPNDH